MPGDLDADIAKLVAGGADPRRARVVDGRTFIDMTGFRWPHLIAAAVAGAMMLAGVAGVGMATAGRWVAGPADRIVIEGIQASGTDISRLSAADLSARLTYTHEDGRILVNLVAPRRPELDRLLIWLRTQRPEIQAGVFDKLMLMAKEAAENPGRMAMIAALSKVAEADATVLAQNFDEVAQLLRNLAQKSDGERKWLINAGFPGVPRDQARADLWMFLNSTGRRHPEIISAIKDAAMADPNRLPAALSYLRDKTPIPACLTPAATCAPCPVCR